MIFLMSPLSTLLLAALLIGYLVIGKLTALELNPQIMIALATMAIVHGCWVIVSRNRTLLSQKDLALKDNFSKRTAILEIVMLLGLLATLSLGTANYLLGFQGYLEIIPSGEDMPLGQNLQIIERGAFSQPKKYNQVISKAEFADHGRMMRFQLRSSDRKLQVLLERGKPQFYDGLRMVYQGDGYLLALMVMRGTHDYLAAPLLLRKLPESEVYRSRLDVTEPGASGEVTIDPVTGITSAVVNRNGLTEFSGPIQLGQVATQGEMRLQVTSSSHFGRVLVQHRNYRTATLVTLGTFLLAGITRLILGWRDRRRNKAIPCLPATDPEDP